MARDYSKYSVEGLGENLNKRQLVFTIVKDYIEKNNPTLENLLATFPDALQGSQGVVRKESEVEDPKRFNMKAPLKIKNGMHVVVSNQWGDNLPGFMQHAEKMEYSIQQIKTSENSTTDDNSSVNITAKLVSNEEYGETFGYVNVELTMNASLINEIENKSNYLNLIEIINEIQSNYMEEIIVEMDNQSGLDQLKESDFDWFNLGPQLVIAQINEIDLSVIHDYFLNKAHSTQVTELLAIEEDEIDDYVSDFIQSTRYEISKEEFDNITNADSEAVATSDEEEEEEENEDGLVIPMNLVVQNYNSAWGRYIILTYENSSDCEEENFKIKIDTVTNSVLPFNKYADELTKKWFNSWEVLLSSDNNQEYTSIMQLTFTDSENSFMSSDNEWAIVWHDQFEELTDGKFPAGVTAETINNLFSNEWFSQLVNFVSQNGF
jgi:hypothetical protein